MRMRRLSDESEDARPLWVVVVALLAMPALVVICLLTTACASDATGTDQNGVHSTIWTDEGTGVEYIVFKKSDSYGASVVPRLNPDGSLVVDTGEK